MEKKFDPYYKWLAIPPEQQPPHYYRLLGIKEFTSDLNVIEGAADRQAAHIRSFLDGAHKSSAEKILENIETVKDCLLDPERKSTYDAKLRQKLGSEKPVNATKAAPAKAKPATDPGDTRDEHLGPIVAPSQQVHRRSNLSVAIAALLLLAAAGGAYLYFGGRADPVTVHNDPPPEPRQPLRAPDDPAVKPSRDDKQPQLKGQDGGPPPTDADDVAKKPDDVPEPDPVDESSDPPSDLPDAPLPNDTPQPDPMPPPDEPKPDEPPAAPPTLLAVPNEDAQKEKLELIRDVFKQDYDKAKAMQHFAELARMLLQEGEQTLEDPIGRFCLFSEARDIASGAGDVDTAMIAIGRLSRYYDIDQWTLKLGVVESALKEARGSAEVEPLVRKSFEVIDGAMSADRYDAAEKIGSMLAGAMRRIRDVNLKKEVVARRKDIDEFKVEYGKAEQALAKLKMEETDTEASLVAGRFVCFLKGDWKIGLPLLAAGSDIDLAALAKADLAAPTDSAERLLVADGWWKIADQKEGLAQQNIYQHAASWVRQVRLQGIAKIRWEKRLTRVFGQTIPTRPEAPVATNDPPIKPAGNIPDNPAYTSVLLIADESEKIIRLGPTEKYEPRVFEAERHFKHGTGAPVDGGWTAQPNVHRNAAIIYGPFVTDLPKGGPHTAVFRMKVGALMDYRQAGTIDVFAPDMSRVLAHRAIVPLHDKLPADTFVDIPLHFHNPGNQRIEFRVWFSGNTEITVDKVTVGPSRVNFPKQWRVAYYAMPDGLDPREKTAWQQIISAKPVGARILSALDHTWPYSKQQNRRFGFVAQSQVKLPPGRYQLWAKSDDGMRVTVNGQPLINYWHGQPAIARAANRTLQGGQYAVQVEYFESGGLGTFQLWFQRAD
jgi:hypothetical protein